MELRQAIMERRSIRKFKDKEIPKELIEEIIKLSMWAPSAMNTQPWKFYVICGDKKEELKKIMSHSFKDLQYRLHDLFKDKMVNMIEKYFTNFGNAPYFIVVTTDKLSNEVYQIGAYESAAAAIQNLSLAAHEAGLATCWMTGILWTEGEILKFLNAPDKRLVGILTLGYPDQEPPIPPRKDEKIIWIE